MRAIDNLLSRWLKFFHVYRDCVFSIFVLVISSVFLVISGSIPISSLSISVFDSSRFLPQLVFGMLIFFSIISFIKALKDLPEKKENPLTDEDRVQRIQQMKRAIVSLALIAVAIFLMPRLGFVITATIYMFVNMMFMTQKEYRKPIRYVIVAALFAVGIYLAFREFIYVYLPAGILKGVF